MKEVSIQTRKGVKVYQTSDILQHVEKLHTDMIKYIPFLDHPKFEERSKAALAFIKIGLGEAAESDEALIKKYTTQFKPHQKRNLWKMKAQVILAEVSKLHNVPIKCILSRDRAPKIVAARRHVACRMRNEIRDRNRQLSSLKIGKFLKRDHATILAYLKQAGIKNE